MKLAGIALALACALVGTSATAQSPANPAAGPGAAGSASPAAGAPVKIGVLTDMNGVFSALAGQGSVVAARMAVEDFGGKVGARPVQVLAADHQNKADVGLQVARAWFDTEGVGMIVDVPNSAVVLAVQQLAREKDRMLIASGGGTADLTGKACSPNGIHWTWDTYALASSTARAVVEEGGKDWFFLTADFAFGYAMERDVTGVLDRLGGRVLGRVRHPLDTADFSSFLLQAQASRASIIALANGGSDLSNSIKQAREYGLVGAGAGRKLAALALFITDIHGMGLPASQGLLLTTAFYWDRTDETRAWSQRFYARHGAMPTMSQAGVYSAVLHYLRAVEATGSSDAGPVMARMRATPIHDFFAENGVIREDGRMVHDMYLVEVKAPAESRHPWDYYRILRTVPGDQAFRPLAESECPLIRR